MPFPSRRRRRVGRVPRPCRRRSARRGWCASSAALALLPSTSSSRTARRVGARSPSIRKGTAMAETVIPEDLRVDGVTRLRGGAELGTAGATELAVSGRIAVDGQVQVGPADQVVLGGAPPPRVHVADGAIMPAAGDGEGAGILFPSAAGAGAAADRAWIRYYTPTPGLGGTRMVLGVGNGADDVLMFEQAGGERLRIADGTVTADRLAATTSASVGGRLLVGPTHQAPLGGAPQPRVHVADGAIVPAAGDGEGAGILFPSSAGAGVGADRAWLRYFASPPGVGGTRLVLGVGEGPDDVLSFEQMGEERMRIADGAVAVEELSVEGGTSVAGDLRIGPTGQVPLGGTPTPRVHVADGAIMPATGAGEAAGILFAGVPGQAAGRAFLRYSAAQSAGQSRLTVGVGPGADDVLAFEQMGVERMRIADGKVGIGTTAPTHPLSVMDTAGVRQNQLFLSGRAGWSSLTYNGFHGQDDQWRCPDPARRGMTIELDDALNGHGRCEIYGTRTPGGTDWQKLFAVHSQTETTHVHRRLEVHGDSCADRFCNLSDGRLKDRVQVVDDALARVSRIRGVTYVRRPTDADGDAPGTAGIGVIAQEVEGEFPELVSTMGEEAYLAVDYAGLTGILIEAVKQLRDENAALRARVEALEA
ncbi:tail fiber domain-containing protein [Geodermatophilus sp. SYSU D00814]